jgi:O-antigen/teichoic acid export membrane protein
MLKSSLITIGTRGLTAVINFLLAVISARYLGAEGRGFISIFILNSTLVQLAAGFIGGAALVYLFPRHHKARLYFASLYWVTAASLLIPLLIAALSKDARSTLGLLIAVSWLQSVLRVQSGYLISQERMLANNLINLLYPFAAILSVWIFFEWLQRISPVYFLWAVLAGSLASVLAGVFTLRNEKIFIPVFNVFSELKAAWKYGYVVQTGNIIQLLNYRLSYYLLDYFLGKAAVGLFSMATSLAEVLWITTNSFAVNLYSKISNSSDAEKNISQTLSTLRLVLAATVVPSIMILILPGEFYAFIFGEEFFHLASIFPWLIPGVLLLTINIILVHYFSGSGQPAVALKASLLAFVSLIVFSFTLIPAMGTKGAALASSVGYTASALSAIYFFNKVKRLRVKDFVFSRSDLKLKG